MAGRTNPRPETPNNDPDLRPVQQPSRTLVEDLGGTVDEMRQLYADFGLRPYRVFSVVVRWTGGATGRGDAVVESEVELLPTPRLVDMGPVRGVSTPAGRTEKGGVQLREISPRYTEDDIRTLFHTQPLPQDRDGFLEVRVDCRDGSTTRRRFIVSGVPFRDAEKFEWRTRLLKQDANRSRAGKVQDDVPAPGEVELLKF